MAQAGGGASSWCVEYARSGRSKCRRCRVVIKDQALRVGRAKLWQDGSETTEYYHLDCMSTSMLAKVGNADNLADNLTGYEELSVDDQHKVLLKVLLPVSGPLVQPLDAAGTAAAAAGVGMSAVPGYAGVKPEQQPVIQPAVPLGPEEQHKAQPDAPSDPRLSKVANPSLQKDPNAVYMVQYAASSRAKCGKCRELISLGSLREGVSFEAAFGMGTSWKHWDCVSDVILRNIGCVGNLKGWDELEPADLQRVEASFLNPPKLKRINHKIKQAEADATERQAASAKAAKPAAPAAATAVAAGSGAQAQGEQDLAGFLQATMAGGYPPAAALAMALTRGGQLGKQAAQLLVAGTLATDPGALIAQAAAVAQAPAIPAAPTAAAAAPAAAQAAEVGPAKQAPEVAVSRGRGKSRSKKAAGGVAAKKAKPAKRQRRRKEASDVDEGEAEEYEDQNLPSPGNESDEEWRPGKCSVGKKRGRRSRR